MSTAAKSRQERHLWAQRTLSLFLLVMMGITMIGIHKSPVAAALARGERVVTLMFGIDAADASRHTDTLMVTSFDPLQNKINLLSIPRDTKISLPGFKFNRVNEIFGYHMRRSNDSTYASLEVKKGVETILSSDSLQLTIPNFLQVDYSIFTRLVDILGGVWVTVKNPMNYDDNAGHYHFHKEPGRYLLQGQEALFYVRFRGPTGDRGRIYRQQEFIRNMLKRLANPINILEFPRMVSAVTSSVKTNFSFWDVFALAVAARRVRSADIGFFILPGRPKGPYWTYTKEAAAPFAAHVLQGRPMEEISTPSIVPQADRITVNVWNASGQKNLAGALTRYLRRCGYDVVDWGTYAAQQIPTRIVDRRGNILQAQEVADQLGIENVHSEPNTKALVDVEVIVGQDFQAPAGLDDGIKEPS